MLSNPKKITSAKQASGYYKQADYYTKGEDNVDISSAWLGKAADALELEGFVDHKQFEAVMAGVLPDGTILDHENRVIGWDLTFSAPKSVSVMALVGGDDRLMDAHFEAVKDTVNFIEKEFAVTRKTEKGETKIEKTANNLVAAFTHTTSRSLDCNLHTHTLFMNVTKNEEGQWRALESNPLYDNRMLSGLVYQNSLARRAFELGYDVKRNDRTGQFDLVAVPDNVISEFSQRRRQIEETAKANGVSLDDAKAMEEIALNTRNTKQNVPTSQIISDWENRAQALGFDYNATIDKAIQTSASREVKQRTDVVDNVLRLAIENLSFKDSVFSRQQLIKESLRFDTHAIEVNQLSELIAHLVDKGELLETRMDQTGQERQIAYTTPKSVDREKEILGMVKAGVNDAEAMGTKQEVADFIERYNRDASFPLNKSQTNALIGLATNEDRFQGLQGLPGVGKSTLMHAANAFANEQGLKLIGIAPTGTAAQELFHKANMETRTIDSLLEIDKHRDKAKYIHEPNTIYVVDESGMVSDRHTLALMRLNNVQGSRMIDAGDINQLPAMEAGAPFEQKQKLSYAFEVMNDIKRQKNPLLKRMVYKAIDDSIGKAFQVLEKSPDHNSGISNIDDNEKRLDASVNHYMTLFDKHFEQGETLSDIVNKKVKLVTPLNLTKDASNNAIRQNLIDKNRLDPSQYASLLTLMPKGLSPTEQAQAIGFEVFFDNEAGTGGDVIRFHKDIKELGIKQGDYFHVGETYPVGDTRLLLNHATTGRSVTIDADKYKEDNTYSVFSASRKSIVIGEQLRWRDTYQTTDIKNGQSLEVTNIDNKQQTYSVVVDDGRTMTLPMNYSGGHNDYNYAITPNSFQGGSAEYVILNYGANAKRLISRNNLIVSLTRGEAGTYVYADNAEKIAKLADTNNRSKSSALAHIGQSGQYKDNLPTSTFKKNLMEAHEGVIHAVEHLSGQFSAFSQYEIMRHAMRYSGQESGAVRNAIKALHDEGHLIEVNKTAKHETFFTSKRILADEKSLRQHLKSPSLPIKITDWQFHQLSEQFGISHEATTSLKDVLNNPHRVNVINARQNPETQLFNHALVDALSVRGKSIGFVATGNVEEHNQSLGHEVMSLNQYEKAKHKADVVVVLDSHNASAKALNRFLTKSDEANSRVILQGITLLSQEFGHKDALSNLAKTANQHSQVQDLLTSSTNEVDKLIKEVDTTITNARKQELEKTASVVQNESDRRAAIINEYLLKPSSSNIISASKQGAMEMSALLRKHLKENNSVTKARKHTTLSPVYLSNQEKLIASEYQVGQILLFNRKGERDGFSRDIMYVIEHIDEKSNKITLRSSEGTKTLSAHELNTRGFSVNEKQKLEIGVGEKLRFTTGVFEKKIPSNANGSVLHIDHKEKTMTVELDSGRKVELDLNKRSHQFIQHGYTQSMNQSSKLPMNRHALIELDARFKSSSNVQNFLKALSNAKQSVSLYADKRSTVSNYLHPSKDKTRNLDDLLRKEVQKSVSVSKAQETSHERARSQQQRSQHEHEHLKAQQRER